MIFIGRLVHGFPCLNCLAFGGPTTSFVLKFQKSHLKSDEMKSIREEMFSILRIFRRFRGFPPDRYTSKIFQCMQISFKGINAFSFSTRSIRMNSAVWIFSRRFPCDGSMGGFILIIFVTFTWVISWRCQCTLCTIQKNVYFRLQISTWGLCCYCCRVCVIVEKESKRKWANGKVNTHTRFEFSASLIMASSPSSSSSSSLKIVHYTNTCSLR